MTEKFKITVEELAAWLHDRWRVDTDEGQPRRGEVWEVCLIRARRMLAADAQEQAQRLTGPLTLDFARVIASKAALMAAAKAVLWTENALARSRAAMVPEKLEMRLVSDKEKALECLEAAIEAAERTKKEALYKATSKYIQLWASHKQGDCGPTCSVCVVRAALALANGEPDGHQTEWATP